MGGLFSRRSANSDQMDVRQNQDIAEAVRLVKSNVIINRA